MGNVSSLGEDTFHCRYTLGKQLGKGAQGRVHLCVDKITGTQRAVKIIDRSAKTAWATYRREVELCRAVSSTNVMAVLEEFVDSSYCYVVMEKFDGHLRKGLKFVAKECGDESKGLAEPALRRMVRQVLSGVRHLHESHIVHRDVKSHNILLDRLDVRDARCRLVLGDLGLARRLDPGRLLCAQVGTRKYWAPDFYDKRYWHVVDVFALGVLVFLAVCAQYPYLDEQQTRERDVFADGVLPRYLSSHALNFMRLLLAKDPNGRQNPAELVRHPWLCNEEDVPERLFGTPISFGPKVIKHGRTCHLHQARGDLNNDCEEEERLSQEPVSGEGGDSEPAVLPFADASFCDSAVTPSTATRDVDVSFPVAFSVSPIAGNWATEERLEEEEKDEEQADRYCGLGINPAVADQLAAVAFWEEAIAFALAVPAESGPCEADSALELASPPAACAAASNVAATTSPMAEEVPSDSHLNLGTVLLASPDPPVPMSLLNPAPRSASVEDGVASGHALIVEPI